MLERERQAVYRERKGIHLMEMIDWPGFYTKLNVWGSLGLNFDYDRGPIIENGGPQRCIYNFGLMGPGTRCFQYQ